MVRVITHFGGTTLFTPSDRATHTLLCDDVPSSSSLLGMMSSGVEVVSESTLLHCILSHSHLSVNRCESSHSLSLAPHFLSPSFSSGIDMTVRPISLVNRRAGRCFSSQTRTPSLPFSFQIRSHADPAHRGEQRWQRNRPPPQPRVAAALRAPAESRPPLPASRLQRDPLSPAHPSPVSLTALLHAAMAVRPAGGGVERAADDLLRASGGAGAAGDALRGALWGAERGRGARGGADGRVGAGGERCVHDALGE